MVCFLFFFYDPAHITYNCTLGPYSVKSELLVPAPFSLSKRFSYPHEKRNKASRFFRTSVINYKRNLGQRRAEEEDDDGEVAREMEKKRGGVEEEEEEEVGLAGGPTAVNRDGSSGAN